IAHEINNPVNFILGSINGLQENLVEIEAYSAEKVNLLHKLKQTISRKKQFAREELIEFLQDEENTGLAELYNEAREEVNQLISSIRYGAERTAEIVKGLRLFSRVDEDHYIHADLTKSIEATLVLLKGKHGGRIRISKHYSEIPSVECSLSKINQVFVNLLSNAIQAIEDKGSIDIGMKLMNDDWVQITISDTGKGISEEIHSKVFDPFFTTQEVGLGTGLGLSIAKGIIDDHSGRLYFDSNHDKGTTFFIEIPVNRSVINQEMMHEAD
ncbi:MAG: HAMP domain-containing histidine kinase, partial [Cyclobacteriaceae bacterium]